MADLFSSHSESLSSPPSNLTRAVPSDTQDLAFVSRAINVAQSGTLRVTTLGGSVETVFVAAGIVFPLRAKRIWASGTSATGIVAMY